MSSAYTTAPRSQGSSRQLLQTMLIRLSDYLQSGVIEASEHSEAYHDALYGHQLGLKGLLEVWRGATDDEDFDRLRILTSLCVQHLEPSKDFTQLYESCGDEYSAMHGMDALKTADGEGTAPAKISRNSSDGDALLHIRRWLYYALVSQSRTPSETQSEGRRPAGTERHEGV